MKKSKLLILALVVVLAIASLSFILTACGEDDAKFTISEAGKYSFGQVSGADKYVLEVYKTGDLNNGAIPEGATAVMTQETKATSGTASCLTSQPWNDYTVFLFSVEGSTRTQQGNVQVFWGKGGTLSAPTLSASANEWKTTITVNVSTHYTKEMLTSYELEVYKEEACTTKLASTTLSDITVTAGQRGYTYTGNTYVFNVPEADIPDDSELTDGKLPAGSELKYYAKVKANGSSAGDIKESAWSAVLTMSINGSKASSGGPPF